jgi:peptidoglycan-N-acetylglucosamine deacetylase
MVRSVAGRLRDTGALRFLAVVPALLAVLAAVLVIVVRVAGASAASAPAEQPLAVSTSSLSQQGQDLVWQLSLAEPFSPAGLQRDHRSLCLVIERAGRGSSGGSQLCLSGNPIAAKITRSSDRELTATFLPASVGLGYGPLRWQVISRVLAPACSPSVAGTNSCTTLFPAAPSPLRLHVPQLVGCIPQGPDLIFHGSQDRREIALTFDDGPWWEPPSNQFVSLLAREHVPATFFEIGEHISTYDPHGTLEREMLADGDMIGDHTWSHPDMAGLSAAAQREQIAEAAAAIRKATHGFEPCLFRAPYGVAPPSLVREAAAMGFTTIQWDVDPRDWALPGVGAIIDNVVSNAHSGAIVEEHFGGGPRYETLDALPREIAALRAKGYELVTLTQMLGYRLVYR